jgi:hypothetical protein
MELSLFLFVLLLFSVFILLPFDPISLSKFRYILYNNLLFEQYTWSYKLQKYSYDISIILNYDYFAEQIDYMVTLFLRKRDVNL